MDDASTTPIIRLWDAGLGLVVPFPSGVRYANQTAGTACYEASVEGVYIPMGAADDPGTRVEEALLKYFQGAPHFGTGAQGGLTRTDADYIDGLLDSANVLELRTCRVDRSQLDDSFEAWVWLTCRTTSGGIAELFSGFPKEFQAVLTWTNSD